MPEIGEVLKNRIELYRNNSNEYVMEREGKEYQKRWAKGVQFFQKKINEDRVIENRTRVKKGIPPQNLLSFISIRQKVSHIKDIDTLKWFYGQCKRYEENGKKEKKFENTFSRCFFGSLKLK